MPFTRSAFAGLLEPLDRRVIARAVKEHDGDHGVGSGDHAWTCERHLKTLLFAQFAGVKSLREIIEGLLRRHQVRLAEDMAPAERWALACPALPTCGLALTEAERVRDDIVAAVEARLRCYGLERERLSIRITGCPNGCARPYTGDIGIVGRVPGSYSLYVGGDFEGTRLNQAIAERLDITGLADALDPLFALFACSRRNGEGFGDFCHRIGIPALQQVIAGIRRQAA